MNSRKAVMSIILTLLLIVCLHFFTIVHVCGESMSPTLHNNYYGVAVRTYQPKVGDIVIAKTDNSELIVKRVVGSPGDIVNISEKGTFNNGVEITPDISNSPSTSELEVKVPKDHYFLLGDNRDNSYDSRVFGAIDKHYINYKLLDMTVVNNNVYMSIKYIIIILFIFLIWKDELKERRHKWVEQVAARQAADIPQEEDITKGLGQEDTE